MGTQAEKAPCAKTTFPAEMVHSHQGKVSAPQFYQISYVTHVTTSHFFIAVFLMAGLGKPI